MCLGRLAARMSLKALICCGLIAEDDGRLIQASLVKVGVIIVIRFLEKVISSVQLKPGSEGAVIQTWDVKKRPIFAPHPVLAGIECFPLLIVLITVVMDRIFLVLKVKLETW